MGNLLLNIFAMSIAGSAIVGLMLLFRPLTVKIFSAKWQYGIGKMAIAFFLIPVSFFTRKFSWFQTAIENYSSEPFTNQNGFINTMDTLMKKHLSIEVMGTILFIWLVGAMVFAGWHFFCYRRFTKELWASSIPVPQDAAATILLSSCKSSLGIHGEVKLMQNHRITSPMLVGLRRPIILLPSSNMPGLGLKLVLTHELMHLKRKDLWAKMLALVAGTLHWFNPLVHVLRKDISAWGELSCDEALAAEMSLKERRLYGEAILNTLETRSGIETAFCSSLCGQSRKSIERRLMKMLNVKKTKRHIAVFSVVAILGIASIGTAVSAFAADNISKNGHFSATANEKQLEMLNELYNTDISFGELVEAVYPEALAHIPEYALKNMYNTKVIWPDEDTPSSIQTTSQQADWS